MDRSVPTRSVNERAGRTGLTPRRRPALLAALFAVMLLAWGCQREQERQASPPLKLSLGTPRALHNGLLAVGEDKGFFRDAGLEVSFTEFPCGKAAFEALGRGEVDLATGADFAFIATIDDDPSLRVVASLGVSAISRIVARGDRNIQVPADLIGKRIGVSPDTTSEYYLYSFLLLNGIPRRSVCVVAIPSTGIVEAFAGGEVDAISTWEPVASEAATRLEGNCASWQARPYMGHQWLLIAKEDATRSPEPLRRLLLALLKTQDFLLAHEDEAISIYARRQGLAPEYARRHWDEFRLTVSLNQALVNSLEDFLKWRMSKEGRPGKTPNVLRFIHQDALREVSPRAITIFR